MANNEHRPSRQILKKARCTKYVIVELPGGKFKLRKGGEEGCWMGRRRIFRNSREFSTRPDKSEYTHVRRGSQETRLARASSVRAGALFWSWAVNGLKGKKFLREGHSLCGHVGEGARRERGENHVLVLVPASLQSCRVCVLQGQASFCLQGRVRCHVV